MERPNAWKKYDDATLAELDQLCEDYRRYISENKTERECVTSSIKLAEEAGYVSLETALAEGRALKAGDKVYAASHNKTLMLVNLGRRPMEQGMNILGAHIDSPRLDLKQNPLYEAGDMAYLDTHYYGGVKAYHWVATPLALHGVICKKDGTTVDIAVGEDPADPVFCISDLLIHLASDQMEKPAGKAVDHENLDVIVAGRPVVIEGDEEVKEPVKQMFLDLIKEKYDVEEEDFLSAEIEVVPAGPARDMGLDRSMILGHGQDDRVCAYTEMMAEIDNQNPEWTSVVIFADKEEVGSDGNTGMHSRFLEYFLADLAEPFGVPVRRVLSNSKCLSADVSAAYDPSFADAYEKQNSSFLNYGVCVVKYTGSGGKGGTNDCNARFTSQVCAILDKADVVWQFGELGKVDQGGGGTVAKFISELDVDTIDIGVPVLCMHAPMEIISKVDLYETYRGFYAFLVAELD